MWRGEDPSKVPFKPKYDGAKRQTRYFPGKTPQWGEGGGDGEDDPAFSSKSAKAVTKEPDTLLHDPRVARDAARRNKQAAAQATAPVMPGGAASSRLRRLQAAAGDAVHLEERRQERMNRHREVFEARVLEEASAKQGKDGSDDDMVKDELKKEDLSASLGPVGEVRPGAEEDDGDLKEDEKEAMAFRRERAREMALAKRKEEEDLLLKKEDDQGEVEEDDLGEEESEEESSEDDDPRRGALLKPVFVSRNQRETIKEKEEQERQDELAELKRKEAAKEKIVESKSLLVDEIKREEEAEATGLHDNEMSDPELLDDDDEKNEAEEYEKWKIRELRRIKRDKEERMEKQKELEWIEARRRMTDEEREADDAKLDSNSKSRDEVKQFNFLQKYYHRGGFFQDKARTGEEPIYLRDYHEPTAEETFNKELLPKAMQLRRGQFGKKGQVKHTHLTEADTTDKTAAWAQQSKQVEKYQERMASAKGINKFDRPGLRGGGASGSRGPA